MHFDRDDALDAVGEFHGVGDRRGGQSAEFACHFEIFHRVVCRAIAGAVGAVVDLLLRGHGGVVYFHIVAESVVFYHCDISNSLDWAYCLCL